MVTQSVSLLAGLGVRTAARAGRAGRGRLSRCCRSPGVQAGGIVQTGAEQSLWVRPLLNLGQRVPLTLWSVCVGQRNCPWHLAALGLWVTGESPPGLCSVGREVCLLDFSSSSNQFLAVSLLRAEGVSWVILHAPVNGSTGELWAREAECPVRDAHSPEMKCGKRRRKRDWGRNHLSFGFSVKSLVLSVIFRRVLPAQLSLAVPCPP